MRPDTKPLVLAVDDERANLSLLQRLLGEVYQVMCITDARAVLDMLVQAPFDLVLLDIMMPGMSGLDVLASLRANPKFASIPVILISALSDSTDIWRGLEMGANDYITKPLDAIVTLARVRTQIRLKRLEDERSRALIELQHAQEMKANLIRVASHDLKNPLTNLRLVSSLLRETSVPHPDSCDLIEALDLSLEAMHTVITDFLDTAALEDNALHLKLGAVAVQPIVETLIDQFGIAAKRKSITLTTRALDGMIKADARRFEQALGNLISNAIKYSPRHSTVTIWTQGVPERLRVHVGDQGPGIPLHEQSRLFTQFGKLTPRPTGGESSTGLGLWIVKHLITLQDGTVGVESTEQMGSDFWIELPQA
ncbi:MAG: hybrid sensor histidine kinase/response regulator [Anaerolinea sp.]|nr:hybrid sensor histidine kinase/response regulator [Anaerolinea sp.]